MFWKRALLGFFFVAAACSPGAVVPTATVAVDETSATVTSEGVPEGETRINKRVDDSKLYSYSQLLPLDGIRPVYQPEFATAGDSPLQEDELILGITLEGEAKAYPITVLRHREMVNDELAGIPILVTW